MDSSFMYIHYKRNVKLKNLKIILNNFFKLVKVNTAYDNDVSLLNKAIADAYFVELKNTIDALYQNWESSYINNNINIYLELIKHLDKCAS